MRLVKNINHNHQGVVVGETDRGVSCFIFFGASLDFACFTRAKFDEVWKDEKGDAEALLAKWADDTAVGKTTDAVSQLQTMAMLAKKKAEKPLPLDSAKLVKAPKGQPEVKKPEPLKPQPTVRERIQKIAESKKRTTPVEAEPKKAEPKKAVKAEPKKVEPKKAAPKKAEPKKAEPKKAEPKKAAPKKAEPKVKGEPTVVEKTLASIGKRPITVAEIATKIGADPNTVRQAVFQLKARGKIDMIERGTYVLTSR